MANPIKTPEQLLAYRPLKDLLAVKGNAVYAAAPTDSVFTAISLMADHGVGFLVVMDGKRLVGVLSERDYARKVVLMGRSSKETPVSEILTEPLIAISPDTSVDEAMRLITTHRIRHLPVMRHGELEGLISIGDLVQWIAFAQDQTIEDLSHYIEGKYPC